MNKFVAAIAVAITSLGSVTAGDFTAQAMSDPGTTLRENTAAAGSVLRVTVCRGTSRTSEAASLLHANCRAPRMVVERHAPW
jgi:hypothetical protein